MLQRSGAPGAVAAFRQLVQLRPNDPDAHNNLGLALIQSGDATGSIPEFEAALQLRPADTGYRTNLGQPTCRRLISTLPSHNFKPL